MPHPQLARQPTMGQPAMGRGPSPAGFPRRGGAVFFEEGSPDRPQRGSPQPQQNQGIQGSPVGGALGGLLGGGIGYGLGKLKEEYMPKEPSWGEILSEGPGAWEDNSAQKGMLIGSAIGAPGGAALMDMHQKGKLPSLSDLGVGSADDYNQGPEKPEVFMGEPTGPPMHGGSPSLLEQINKESSLNKESSYQKGYREVIQKARNSA